MNSFYRGTILLIIAAFISESLEFLVNMILARELGEHGMGLYMSILPVVFLVVIIASFELPISISKFVAEKKPELHYNMLKHTIRLTIFFVICFMLISAVILPALPIFKEYHPLIKWLLILLIPIVAFSSIARGYFMGVQQMGKIAVSNFLRKCAQLIILFFVYHTFQFDLEMALLIALATLIGSELLVCAYLVAAFIIHFQLIKSRPKTFMNASSVRKNLLAVSLPTTGLRLFHSLTHAVQPFLVKIALVTSGLTGVMATEQYGMLAGVAMSIGFFPAFIGHSLMIMLIPNVSEAAAKKDRTKLVKLLQQSMIITICYGFPAIIIMYIFAEPLTHLFFQSSTPAFYLKMLWPYFLFQYFVYPMQSYLIGLGLVKEAFFHTVWSHVISFAMMYVLGSMPQFGMEGVIIGMNMCAVLLMLMHYFTICNKIGVNLLLGESNLKKTTIF
ncbi:polysaccharide biosynthesis protein [Metabacillus fastidiosus]|uniref:Polysaccharide biosynthesis protein n=1 Tax=Metabacillus fastidiosus TaxID=1458 RepID=A0ABU6P6D9_9BACI|nr:polysaccharide biosynthesis protein [Metabacillus fastidiosus]MED4403736.1 polysaccharide biosynthesis protein [Metabacillus fastidiosus]MED4463554.1 polysaccharide biosynthesis protein [Metabacillus fastidiosus]